jgi:Flp pilus assembly pilin Flp
VEFEGITANGARVRGSIAGSPGTLSSQTKVILTSNYWGKCSQPPNVPLPVVEDIVQSMITPTNFPRIRRRERIVKHLFRDLWRLDEGQDVAEYSVMLAVILVVIVGTIHLIGGNSNNIFSAVASSIVQ